MKLARKVKYTLLLAILALLICNCVPSTSAPIPTSTQALTHTQPAIKASVPEGTLARLALEYPSVDGSTSAYPLQMYVACFIYQVPCSWQDSFLDMTRVLAPSLDAQASPEAIEKLFNIQHSGTHGAYTNLIEGQVDLILVARLPSEDELQAARNRRLTLDAQAVALDAFVFLVNAGNPVDDMPLNTIRDIYTGKITRWSEIKPGIEKSGEGEDEIHTYQRNPNSGSQELMEALVMKGARMIESPDMILPSMTGPIYAISDDQLGIGYSVYYYTAFIFPNEKVKRIGVDAVVPTSATIKNRSYPLTTEVYAVVRGDTPPDSSAVLLRDWLLSSQGQTVVEGSGYVPIQ